MEKHKSFPSFSWLLQILFLLLHHEKENTAPIGVI